MVCPNPVFRYQAVHAPSEVPESYKDPYNGIIENSHRKTFAGMLSCMDEGTWNVLWFVGTGGERLIILACGPTGGGPSTPVTCLQRVPVRAGPSWSELAGARSARLLSVLQTRDYIHI